mgnify:CR=1 FL=1
MEEITRRPEVSHFHDASTPYLAEYDRDTPEGYSFRVRREKVLALLPDGSGKKILDLASGPGIMIKGLRAKNYTVTCVDAAPGMIELARKEADNDPGVSCEVGDAYSLRFSDASFDSIVAMGLIEYLNDGDRYLSEMRRVLASGGTLILTYPNVWSPWRMWNHILRALVLIFKRKHSGLLHREYTLRNAQTALTQNGFEVNAVSYYNVKLVPLPLDRFFPSATVRLSHAAERLTQTPLKWLATGFIVRAKKR